ncbi:aspartate aminotransferase family protein [Paracoccaceae bacterium GXU_MW_L88]
MTHNIPNDLNAYWMPFTANRQFKANPRMITGAKGVWLETADGRQVLDGIAGLWCCNAGHGAPRIVEAVQKQVAEMDFSSPFQMGHPKQFELANRLADLAPGKLNNVFFTNSGSESVETALKIAIAYHRTRGEAQRVRLVGREKGYHGVNFGGISVGGIGPNRRMFGSLMSGVDHLPHTHDLSRNAFTKGQPEHGMEYADALEHLVTLHGPDTIAAVIVEPVACSGGVIFPPKNYLQRLREITKKYGILLIFDEVICGFGRLGAAFGAERFGVEPDMMTTAKGLTSGVVPMGAVILNEDIYNEMMVGPDHMIELFHGYTYSGHPLACAAGLAALDTYRDEGLFERAREMEPYFADAIFSLKDHPNVIDIRTMGMVGAIELTPLEGQPTARAFSAFLDCYERGSLIRTTGDTIALSPPLTIEKNEIDKLITDVGAAIKAVA